MYSSAFAFGLLQAGYTRGDKFVLFADETSSAEQLVAQMGAIKAGVSVVTLTDKENADALDHALSSTKAKGLIFAPDAMMANKQSRINTINKLMPELSKMYLGDELNVAKYPNLKQII